MIWVFITALTAIAAWTIVIEARHRSKYRVTETHTVDVTYHGDTFIAECSCGEIVAGDARTEREMIHIIAAHIERIREARTQ